MARIKKRRWPKLTRICTVCRHKDLEEINRQLICGGSLRDIARQFNLSKDALSRHKDSHIPESLLKAYDIKEYTAAQKLACRLKDEADLVRELRDEARKQGDINTALRAVDRALKCIELCAKVQGLIQEQSVNVSLQQAQVNIKMETPEERLARYKKYFEGFDCRIIDNFRKEGDAKNE
jgi:adenylyl- and sulfurtransferase ThiI